MSDNRFIDHRHLIVSASMCMSRYQKWRYATQLYLKDIQNEFEKQTSCMLIHSNKFFTWYKQVTRLNPPPFSQPPYHQYKLPLPELPISHPSNDDQRVIAEILITESPLSPVTGFPFYSFPVPFLKRWRMI